MNNLSNTISALNAATASVFKNLYSTKVFSNNTLLDWVKACQNPKTEIYIDAKETTLKYRKLNNKELKRKIPAISVGSQLRNRDAALNLSDRIAMETGFMQFDIDLKDNLHLDNNAKDIRDEIKKIPYVIVAGLSVSGKGVWGLVKVSYTQKYKAHFNQLVEDFASLGINLDKSKGGNPSDLRLYSYDPDIYISENFRIYDRFKADIIVSPRVNNSKPKGMTLQIYDRFNQCLNFVVAKKIDIAPDYEKYYKLGIALAQEFGEDGRNYFHQICQFSPKYSFKDADKDFNTYLKYRGKSISIGYFINLCKAFGI